jgi:Co/Zn/Cd efflux system component
MSNCCDNVCKTDVVDEQQRQTLKIVLVINALMFIVVLIAALIAKSSSLLSGSIDNLGDAITYGLSLYAVSRGNDVKVRVSLFKGILILTAAMAVTGQVMYKLANPAVPIFELMWLMTIISLVANFLCLGLLTKHRNQDINMASVWECSRNDVIENVTVLFAAIGVWLTESQWPDIIIALALILILYRSAFRIIPLSLTEIKKSKSD